MQQQKLRVGYMLTITVVIAHFTACFWAFTGLMSKDETDPMSRVCATSAPGLATSDQGWSGPDCLSSIGPSCGDCDRDSAMCVRSTQCAALDAGVV